MLDRPEVEAPVVVGVSLVSAIESLESVGLVPVVSPYAPRAGEELDAWVVTSDLTEGGTVPIGTQVKIEWHVKLPNVVGTRGSEARSSLEAAKFGVEFAAGSSSETKVTSQSPAAGTLVSPASTVTLTTSEPSVVFEVVGNGSRAMITWIGPRSFSIAQDSSASLPWRKVFPGPAPSSYERGNYSAQMYNGNSITCNTYVNDELVETQTSTGQYAIVSCG